MTLSHPLLAEELPGSVQDNGVTLQQLLSEAVTNNQQLHAAKQSWEATKLRIPQAWALPDPTGSYMLMGQMIETRLGPQEQVFEFEQMVPFPGKLMERRSMALAEANAAQAQMRGIEREVILKVSESYYDLYAVDATLQVVEELKDSLKNLQTIAQARYASEGSSQRDVAKAQTEVSDTLQRLFVLRQQRQTLTAVLNALLDRDPRSAVGRPLKPQLPTLSSTVEDLLELVRQHRPELQEAEAQINRYRHARTLARFEYMPDLSVGFQYAQIGSGMTADPDDGKDAWMVPLKITIPLWQNRVIAGVREANRNLQASQAQSEQAENMAEYEVKDAYYRFITAKQIVELYENALIPQAGLAFQSDQAGYEAGRVDVLNVIDSERVYLNAKIAHYQAIADAMKNFAALERAVGIDLVTSDQ